MSTFNRKRQASPSDQVNQSKRTVPIALDTACCKCLEQFNASGFIHWDYFCANCDHLLCRSCPTKTPSLSTFDPNTHGNVHEKHNELLPQSQLLRSGPTQELEMGQDVEGRQAQELQPQSTKGQKEVETGESSKRSLNMSKCDRCRADKKKCLPVNRVWPTKCELCIKKGFPCSEGKRVVRSTKHAPAPIPSPTNVTSPATTSVSFEERLKQWVFLSSYHKMMKTAKERLEELEKVTTSLFSFAWYDRWKSQSDSYRDFLSFVNEHLDSILRSCSNKLLTLHQSSQNLPGWFLIASLCPSEPPDRLNYACSKCCSEHSRSKAIELESSQDVCGKLMVVQHQLIDHQSTENWKTQHVVLSHEVPERADAIFESLGWPEGTELARNIGIYHPDDFGNLSDNMTDSLNDCLGRSMLHMYMDFMLDWNCYEDYGFNIDTSELKDGQDILGRTALVIACQAEWEDAVELLLEEQADPGLATMYGSLPLHYAAANGSYDICEQLLSHKTRFDIKAKDFKGMTALDWAKEKGNEDVVELLSAEYVAAAGAEQEPR